jgi:hypothetical protein
MDFSLLSDAPTPGERRTQKCITEKPKRGRGEFVFSAIGKQPQTVVHRNLELKLHLLLQDCSSSLGKKG